MIDIRYKRPRTVAEASELAAKTKGTLFFLCGGTDLIVKSKAGKLKAGTWIDLSKLPELKGIEEREDCIYVGAGTSYAALEYSPVIRKELPALHQAVLEVGSPQIRALGTLGGNVANASPAGDGIPPLYAHGARIVLTGPQSDRTVSAETFFRGPGRTVLAPGEIIRGFELPRRNGHLSAFLKLGPRRSLSIAKVSLAVALELKDGELSGVRIGVGAVAPTVIRALKAEKFLEGKKPTKDVYEEAARLAREEVSPISDFRSTAEYRREMAGTLLARALAKLCGGGSERRGGWDVEIR